MRGDKKLLLFATAIVLAFALSIGPVKPACAEDVCKEAAEGFLKAWMDGDYEAMYASLSKSGMGKMSKDEFVSVYKGKEAEFGWLEEYSVKEASSDGTKLVASLKFQTDVPPKTTSVTHSIDMEKDGESCLVLSMSPITPSAPSRLPGGGNPGE